MSCGSRFLLCREMVVERHLLHPRQQACIRVHCMTKSYISTIFTLNLISNLNYLPKSLICLRVLLSLLTCYISVHTKSPSGLDESELRVVDKKWDSALKVIGLGLEISIKDGQIVALLDIAMCHGVFKSSSFVAISVFSSLILYVYAFCCPFCTLNAHQFLAFYIICLLHLQCPIYSTQYIIFNNAIITHVQ